MGDNTSLLPKLEIISWPKKRIVVNIVPIYSKFVNSNKGC
jgi:hypothetical protein